MYDLVNRQKMAALNFQIEGVKAVLKSKPSTL